jgi:hypothetical protein
MTRVPRAQTTAEPAAPSKPEIVPETGPAGAEGEAWLRASNRIAGVAVEQQYGF